MSFMIKEIETNLNAFEAYSLFKDEKDTILLDSSKEDEKLSQFSFIGLNPFLKFQSWGNEIKIGQEVFHGDPFLYLEKLINEHRIQHESSIPFVSGCMGYFSYDMARTLEKIPDTSKEDFKIPDASFIFYDNLVIFDLKTNKTYISSLGKLKAAEKSIEDIEQKIKTGMKRREVSFEEGSNEFFSNFTEEEYLQAVGRIKEYIRSGDVYIANLTQRIWCHSKEDSFHIYEKLRKINKAPFSAFLNFDSFQVVSSSPERFMRILEGRAETRPIKGTRPRGENEEQDERNRLELVNSEKDKSELLMIVDLERNDLSKVCKPHSVKVTELFKLEEYASVFHLVSTVVGELKDGVSAVKCMKECFPGGSITGAPKIRAMEIIEEIEKVKRNLYTGSIGYFDLRGNADFNIVIRTIVKKDGKAFFGAGGGITIESDEKMEYDETLDKARALMKVSR